MIKKILWFINLLLITTLVYTGVRIFYAAVSTRLDLASMAYTVRAEAKRSLAVRPTKKGKSKGIRFSSYQPVINRDLFATIAPEKEPEQIALEDIEKLKKTRLNLKLWGTITGIGEKSYAVIEDTKNKKQQLYAQGDSVQNAKIKLILRKKVVLSVDGKDEILEMADIVNTKNRISSGGSYLKGQISTDEPPLEETVEVSRDKIEESLANINELMRQIRIRPYFKDGEPQGILLSGIRRNSIFEQMGLKSGDIVKGVNGKEIRSVDDALKFYENLKSSDSVEIQIERRGETKIIHYKIN